MNKEKKQKLKRLWNEGVPRKKIAKELGFKSGSSVYYWRKKLELEPRRKPQGYWDDFNNLRKELKPVIEVLGHFPVHPELVEMGRSDIANAIGRHGGYREVQKRMDYEHKRKPKGYWDDPENVDRAYDELKEEHGEVTWRMLCKRYKGALGAIKDGRYDPEIRTWNQYVKSREDEPVHRSPTYDSETKVNMVIEYLTSNQSQREIARKREFSASTMGSWSKDSAILRKVIDKLEVPDVFGQKGLEEIGIFDKKIPGLRNKKTSMFLDKLVDNGLYSPFKISDGMIYVRSDRLEEFKSLKKILGF